MNLLKMLPFMCFSVIGSWWLLVLVQMMLVLQLLMVLQVMLVLLLPNLFFMLKVQQPQLLLLLSLLPKSLKLIFPPISLEIHLDPCLKLLDLIPCSAGACSGMLWCRRRGNWLIPLSCCPSSPLPLLTASNTIRMTLQVSFHQSLVVVNTNWLLLREWLSGRMVMTISSLSIMVSNGRAG